MRFAKSNWSERAREKLARSLDVDIDVIADQVERGISSLWIVGDEIAYMVLRREYDALVVVAFEGSKLREITPYVIRLAQVEGCTSIRFHTNNPALIRMLKEYDPEPIEYVMRIKVKREN